LRSRKGLNLPGIDLGVCAFTPEDRACLEFALEQGVDAVSQSYVEHASDLEEVRDAARTLGHSPFVIAKIERATALEHIDEIMRAADGLMIARGDLGVEIPIERIAAVQKDLVRRSNFLGIPVITATQMLESMTIHRRPTRAEATDVANAILDGTDCVMLSGESAMGRYPVESVAMLARIAASVEPLQPAAELRHTLQAGDDGAVEYRDLIAASVEAALERVSPVAVVVPSRTGGTARSLARYRLPVWILVFSPRAATCGGLMFSYGVAPLHKTDEPDDWSRFVRSGLADHGLEGDLVILAAGPSERHPEANVRMEIIDLRGGS
jgi:pyruvate kinase